MKEQKDFFSANHYQLLSIAWWSKNVAWILLVIYILLAGVEIIQFQNSENLRAVMSSQAPREPMNILLEEPLKAVELGISMAAVILRGIVYYLVLKGISLGLNMIVETDVNYRDRKLEEAVQ